MNKMRFAALVFLLAGGLLAPGVIHAVSVDDTMVHKSCAYCGMDREKYNYSRMVIEYEDGAAVGVCSLHCAAIELAGTTRTVKAVKAADMLSRRLVKAEDAFWVIGGTAPGVMSKQAKWAFARKADAENFIKEKGGVLAQYEDALKAAYADMYEDTKLIRGKRSAPKPATQGTGHQH